MGSIVDTVTAGPALDLTVLGMNSGTSMVYYLTPRIHICVE